MIRVIGLSKAFGGQAILRDIDCHIARGLTTVMIGPSGVGKSVFAKLLVGLHRPDSGEIWFGEQNIAALRERELFIIRRKIGMCFQDGALFNSLSVGENVAFPLRRHTRSSEREIRRIVCEKLQLVGLAGHEAKWPTDLSGGMRKRAGIARAIVLEPELLIFDEPTSGLDPVKSNDIDSLLLALKENHTVLVISHDIVTTRKIADYIGMLHEGRLIAFGSAAAIGASENSLVQQFFRRSVT
ncbi:MAG: ATP-binding cassette domain-containing protein, partial [Cyanobacteria bacterium NC_groundwater_1444_Ag_S-0.65um_54_12]|nr:ATP-binding cassette domain-containing protein [Cyanobacteria bacterium NC_groundwater_1444_Ag_S-0.65um_54_12]